MRSQGPQANPGSFLSSFLVHVLFKAPVSERWLLGHPLGGRQGIPETDRLPELQAAGLTGGWKREGNGRLTQLYLLAWALHLTTEGQREIAGPSVCHCTEGLEALGGMYQRVCWRFISHTFYQMTSKSISFRARSLAHVAYCTLYWEAGQIVPFTDSETLGSLPLMARPFF